MDKTITSRSAMTAGNNTAAGGNYSEGDHCSSE
jgi:hypothetical protein